MVSIITSKVPKYTIWVLKGILRGMLEAGEIGIVCGMYNVESGRVDFYDNEVTMFRHKMEEVSV